MVASAFSNLKNAILAVLTAFCVSGSLSPSFVNPLLCDQLGFVENEKLSEG